jgi:2-polyprenyl-3-methyl-5-hydroxy-6-metoxy-1,4-benzoquinol methylase
MLNKLRKLLLTNRLFYYNVFAPYLIEEKKKKLGFNKRPVEFAFLFKHIRNIYPNNLLDVGTGTTALPHLLYNCGIEVDAIDEIDSYWGNCINNRHFYVKRDNILNPKTNKKYQFITCISVLEHIENHNLAVKNMYDLLDENGYLLLTFPFNKDNYIKNIHDLQKNVKKGKWITQIFSENEVDGWLNNNKLKVVDCDYHNCHTGDFFNIGDLLTPPLSSSPDHKHNLLCILMQKIG